MRSTKKLIALVLALILCLSLVGCGEAANSSVEARENAEVIPESSSDAVALSIGQTVTLDFIEFSFDSATNLAGLPPFEERSSFGISLKAKDGSQYVYAHGKVKNTGKTGIDLANICASMVINGSLSYPVTVTAFHGTSFESNIDPLDEATLYFYSTVPDDVVSTISSLQLDFGMTEGLATNCLNMEDASLLYTISFSAEAGAQNAYTLYTFEPEELSLRQKITTDTMTMSLNEFCLKDKLEEKHGNTTHSYATDSTKKLFCFKGTIRNTGKKEFRPTFAGKMDIDGYEYDIKDWEVTSGFDVDPLEECTFYIFAEVPPSLATSYKTVTLTFGFDDEFNNNIFTNLETLPHVYSIVYNK